MSTFVDTILRLLRRKRRPSLKLVIELRATLAVNDEGYARCLFYNHITGEEYAEWVSPSMYESIRKKMH